MTCEQKHDERREQQPPERHMQAMVPRLLYSRRTCPPDAPVQGASRDWAR
jgi:hypothetical protein